MFVLGTAGHVDHGKSALVHALTGIDPDRLREEKDRGMTIDLGFAWLKLPSGREVGIIDVPGHEHFIKNMLAGVGSIDLALLVVAANEGVMPQTREHLAILDLLEIGKGIVVITKKDLVDDEWLNLVRMEIEELLRSSILSRAPIIATSTTNGSGMAELVATIDRILGTAVPKKDIGRPRLIIDRIFTIAGSGTVVTGTLIDGVLNVGQEIEIVPRGLRSRLRGLQTHKTRLENAHPGSRVAANLVGVNISQLERGEVLTKSGWLTPSTILNARLRLLPYIKHPLRHNITVNLHTGAAEALAKVRLLEKEELTPGDSGWVQLVLSKPLAVVNGDHFIIRSSVETLGGGKILDSHAKRLRRFRPATILNLKAREEGGAEEIVMSLLESKQPLELKAISTQSGLPVREIQPAIESLIHQARILRIGQEEQGLLFTAASWERLNNQAEGVIGEYHNSFPARLGIPKGELNSKLKMTKYPAVLQALLSGGIVIDEGTVVRLPSHKIHLTDDQKKKIEAFLESLAKNPFAPSSELIPESDLLNMLIQQQRVIKVGEGVVFSISSYNEMVDRVTGHLKKKGEITLGEVRDMFNNSRKYAQALLEYLDDKKVTRRIGDERVLY